MTIDKENLCRLKEYGVICVPIYPDMSQREKILDKVKKSLLTFPEYRRDSKNLSLTPEGDKIVYTLGGFGAFGNPASFHTPIIRKLRKKVMDTILPLMKDYIKLVHPKTYKEFLFSQLPDRFALRRKGTAPTAESWHRDITPNQKKGDVIFGGWLNLDKDITQYFNFVPGTHHIEQYNFKSGFATINKEDIPYYIKNRQTISIPPGYLVIFPQHIVHEVVSRKAVEDSYRLYMGWRISKSLKPLNDIENIMNDQGVPLLPSNQYPPVFAANHFSYFMYKPIMIDPATKLKQSVEEWATNSFKENCIERSIWQSGKNVGKSYRIVHRNMRSLETYGFKKYPDYSKEELNLFIPRRIN